MEGEEEGGTRRKIREVSGRSKEVRERFLGSNERNCEI